jgi:hypothetical protein
VFVDECSTNTSLSPIYGWSRRGRRLCFEVPRNWGANVTLLSSMSAEGMGPSLAVEGSTTKAVFETYVEHFLAPELLVGQTSGDGQPFLSQGPSSARAHRGERLRA